MLISPDIHILISDKPAGNKTNEQIDNIILNYGNNIHLRHLYKSLTCMFSTNVRPAA